MLRRTASALAEGSELERPPQVRLDMIIRDIRGSRASATSRGRRSSKASAGSSQSRTSRGETLRDKAAFPEDSAQEVAAAFDAPLVVTSAKSNENVEAAFRNLGGDVVLALLGF